MHYTQEEFNRWNGVKKSIGSIKRVPHIKEGEVWWYACGKNVGLEINGKNERFSRPILVLKKMGRLSSIGLPLTTKRKAGSWLVPFKFQGRRTAAKLNQIRIVSVKRLHNKMGQISSGDYARIKEAFLAVFR